MTDITLLTDHRYVAPSETSDYIRNVLLEDRLVREALESRGLSVHRTHWDDPEYDWSSTQYALFRTTWDYFERYPEFSAWMAHAEKHTRLINPPDIIRWNLDKRYLLDLEERHVHLPPTRAIQKNTTSSLLELILASGWEECILKPVISGAARHTYRITPANAAQHEDIFRRLIAEEHLLLQEFQHHILSEGELSLMVFGGEYSHAVRKRARKGDFRVQDDHGGTVHAHTTTPEEIRFAVAAVAACPRPPCYARVDIVKDNTGQLSLVELELVEPELWLREDARAARRLADAVCTYIGR